MNTTAVSLNHTKNRGKAKYQKTQLIKAESLNEQTTTLNQFKRLVLHI